MNLTILGIGLIEARRKAGTRDREEYLQAYAQFTLFDFILVYKNDRAEDLRQREVQNSTISKDPSQMRQAAKYLPDDVPAVRLTVEHFRTAKQRMLDKGLGRRSVRNYLSAAVFWDREEERGNDFRIHHMLWPETLAAVKQFLNDGKNDEIFQDRGALICLASGYAA